VDVNILSVIFLRVRLPLAVKLAVKSLEVLGNTGKFLIHRKPQTTRDNEKETVRATSGTLRWTEGTDIRSRKGHLLDIHGRLARLRGYRQEQSKFAQIKDIREQNLYAHKNGVAVEIVLNSSCMGGRQLTPAEKHAAQGEYSQISK
jgi:hypothetical protein